MYIYILKRAHAIPRRLGTNPGLDVEGASTSAHRRIGVAKSE